MKCPGCGCERRGPVETCSHCGAPVSAAAAISSAEPAGSADDLLGLRFEPEPSAPGSWADGPRRRRSTPGGPGARGGDFVEMLDDDAIEVGEDDLDRALAARPGDFGANEEAPFRIEDDLFPGSEPGPPPAPAVGGSGRAPRFGTADETVIERCEEVPDQFWAPEVAGLGRRALALLVDQAVLAAVLGVFFLGAFVALRLNGLDAELFLDAAGLRASALPFALLAVALGLPYFSYFHGSTGRTPGKALFGIEVRTASGGPLSGGRALLRSLCAALGLACGGLGIVWALFEPRGRGWADLLSGTVVSRPRREAAAAEARR